MNTVKVYRLDHLSPTMFRRLKAAQIEAAQVWNLCMQTHKTARSEHMKWPGRNELQQATKGKFALHSQSVQMVVHAFLANIETTRQLRQTHQEMKMKYPWRTKRFYSRQMACSGGERCFLVPSRIYVLACPGQVVVGQTRPSVV